MPLQVIITAAKTVSRASDAVFGPPESISVTISATSMMVTATASTSEPKGSPTRWATTSAWCTAASTAAASTSATTATRRGARCRPQVSPRTTRARSGPATTQDTRNRRAAEVMAPRIADEPVRPVLLPAGLLQGEGRLRGCRQRAELDAPDPLHPPETAPAGRQEPDRGPLAGRQGKALKAGGEKQRPRLRGGEPAPVAGDAPHLDAVGGLQGGTGEQGVEPNPGPGRVRVPPAGAVQPRGHGATEAVQLVSGQSDAGDQDPVAGGVQIRYPVEQPGGRR